MPTMFEFNTNQNLTPKYTKDTVVILEQDYTLSTGNKYLTVDAVCSVIECALSKYPVNAKTGKDDGETDGIEWCHVFIATTEYDPYFDEGFVKAKDLKENPFPSDYYEEK